METMKIFARRDDIYGDSVEIRLGKHLPDGSILRADQIVYAPHPFGEFVQPILTLSNHDAQKLMDELWNCGLRPTEGTGSAGAFEAQRRHLEDMRTLVFKQ